MQPWNPPNLTPLAQGSRARGGGAPFVNEVGHVLQYTCCIPPAVCSVTTKANFSDQVNATPGVQAFGAPVSV